MPRPIVYDVTHLVFRMAARAVTGIDRIDLAYGRHFAAAQGNEAFAAFCSPSGPRVMDAATFLQIVVRAQQAAWEDNPIGADLNFLRVRDWLNGVPRRDHVRLMAPPSLGARHWLTARYWEANCRYTKTKHAVPRGGIYLNIAEHWLEYPKYFNWLTSRPDVEAVFFVHDLLPLDYPEYFRPGYEEVFRQRFETMARRGTAFIVSTQVVRERLLEALGSFGRRDVPVHVAPLPSPLDLAGGEEGEPAPRHPYFVLVSTIEPRKNHLLVLNVWRALAEKLGDDMPRLVLIGSRGWENEQVVDMLERCDPVVKHVRHVARVSRRGLVWLVRHAQALLMPSFDEGYGLPLVEGLSLGTPVIASDIATFREVAGVAATLLSPIDGLAWAEAVTGFAGSDSPAWRNAKTKAAAYQAPNWGGYFTGVDQFLNALQ